MTRRRWIADEVSANQALLIGEHARHLAQVLRARVGQEFEISVEGDVRLGQITAISPDRVEFELGEVVAHADQSAITVVIAIFKFDRMEWAIEKCTELGVVRIVPLIAARTEPHLASAAQKRSDRWRRLAHQASEQSRRVFPPEIADPIKLPELLKSQTGLRVVLSEVEQEAMLKNTVSPNAATVTLAFGPEGGWKEEELAAFKDAGWISASLGSTILRSETAAIAGVAVAASIVSYGS